MAITRARWALIAGAATTAACLGLTALTSAQAAPQTAPSRPLTAAAAGDMPHAVEDFNYPNAAKILQEKGIHLKRGDGHIILAECDQAANQIRVMTVKDDSTNRAGTYCFEANSKSGHLTLELPRVFALEAADQPISADLTADGKTQTVKVTKEGFESVGEGTVGGARSVLVELRVTG